MKRVFILAISAIAFVVFTGTASAQDAAKWYPELTGMENHALRAHMRLEALKTVFQMVGTSAGYAVCMVAVAVIESLPANLFWTDAEEHASHTTTS